MAGVALSCISRVSPVGTIGVWSLRNLPPQTVYHYPMFILANLFVFVKKFIFTITTPLFNQSKTQSESLSISCILYI